MARTTQQILDTIIAEKEAQPDLAELTSQSNTAIWRLWAFVTASIIHFFEVLHDAFRTEIQDIIDSNQYGTLRWWYNRVLEFQYGDLLVFINNQFRYPAEDPTKQIVGYCSVTEADGKVVIKVARKVNNEPVQFTGAELDGLQAYVQEIRPVGIQIATQSLPADQLQYNLTVVINPSGNTSVIQANVDATIAAYLNGISFDGTFYAQKLVDAIQAVPGVVKDQVIVHSLKARQGAAAFVQFISSYQAQSGYFKIDAGSFINYTY